MADRGRKRKFIHTIRGRFTLLFLALMTGTVLVTILFGGIYVEKYYLKQKEASFEKIYNAIEGMADYEGGISYENGQYLRSEGENYGVDILLSSASMNVLFANGNSDEMMFLLRDCVFAGDDIVPFYSTNAYVIDTISKNDKYNVYKIHDSRFNADYLLGFGHFDSGLFFIFKSPILNIKENAVIASRFYAIIAVAATLFGSFAAYFTIRRTTKPVLELTDIADRVAHMDFNAKYSGRDASEIGMLGESINDMSKQLERTISELKSANLELQKDIAEKEQIDEMRREFIANVSHELKTPIALIQGYAEGLKEGINDDPESSEWYCDVIIDEAAKMNNMVKQLLNLNQLESGANQIALERFDIVELINGVLNHNQFKLEQAEAVLEKSMPEQLIVWADEFMIEEVITNYITNAINHLSGDRHINISVAALDKKAVVSISNTGENIPEDELEKIWTKFYKVDKARTREYGGNGIGLSIVKAIMEAHNKNYGVYNTDNGVTFWFELDAANELYIK